VSEVTLSAARWADLRGWRRTVAYVGAVAHAAAQWWIWWLPILALGIAASFFVSVSINVTESLPDHVYLVLKQSRALKRGDYVAFRHPGWGPYPPDAPFVKVVRGVPGDVVDSRDRDFYVNGTFVGRAKEKSRSGFPLAAGPTGVIPPGHYFVFTPHPDSFDSRYEATGLISERRITGRAIALF
jgi:conjugal transfer pilin signal peptidase TrbI